MESFPIVDIIYGFFAIFFESKLKNLSLGFRVGKFVRVASLILFSFLSISKLI